jgi:hypothetical protein
MLTRMGWIFLLWIFFLALLPALAKVKYGGLLTSVHREVTVALCKGNHATLSAGVQSFTCASESSHDPRMLISSANIE